jgi:hypothetical protein
MAGGGDKRPASTRGVASLGLRCPVGDGAGRTDLGMRRGVAVHGVNLEALEEASRRAAFAPDVGLVERSWQDRRAAWVPDVLAEPDLQQQLEEVGEPVHGWFGFPVWEAGEIVGVVEFFSREVRQPNEALLHMTQELGRLFGQLLENAAGRAERSDSRPRRPPPDQLQAAQEPPVAVSSALRDLGEAVATVAGAMERQPVGGRPRVRRSCCGSSPPTSAGWTGCSRARPSVVTPAPCLRLPSPWRRGSRPA